MQNYTHLWKWFWYLIGLMRPFEGKEVRKVIYRDIYNSMKDYKDFALCERKGFCTYIWLFIGHRIPLYKFPELYYYRPMITRRFLWWFPTEDEGMEKRLKILKKII